MTPKRMAFPSNFHTNAKWQRKPILAQGEATFLKPATDVLVFFNMEGAWRLLLLACLIGMVQSTNITAECSDRCDSEVDALVQLGPGAKHADALTGRRRRRRRRRRSSDGTTRRRRSKGTNFPYVLQAYCGGSWLTLCENVPSGWQQHVGAFDPDIATTPYAATSDSSAADNYIALGGGKVEGTLPSASTIEGWFTDSNANNLDFDMEGVLNGAFSTVAQLTENVQKSSSDTKAQVTCLVGTYSTAETYVDTFDYFGIMIHGDSMTSGSYSIPKDDPTSGGTWPYIQNWLNSDIPNSKIILSLTTDSWLHLPASSNHMEFGLSAQAAEFQRTPPKKVRL